jgi:putative SOS response-associated peptidase YedK
MDCTGGIVKPIIAKYGEIGTAKLGQCTRSWRATIAAGGIAYARRRCIVPVDGFFEWKAIKDQRAKQPFAIAMRDGSPFGLAGLWENWKDPTSGEWVRTFTIITVPANELVAAIHDRMPAILTTTGGSALSPIPATHCDPSPPSC